MNLSCSAIRHHAARLIILATLITGCTYAVVPKTVPPVKGFDSESLTGTTLLVINEEKDARNYDILNDKGQEQGIMANRQAWSKTLVVTLAGEFARRGAQIRAKAPLTLGISLPEIIFNQHNDSYQFKVKVVVASANGWTKIYEAVAESGSGLFESLESVTDRLSEQVLAESVKLMLSDAEFLALIRKKL